jgi:hypothetical protein
MRKLRLNLLVMLALAVLVSASSSVTGATTTAFPSDDAYVDSGNPGTNYGAATWLYVGDENGNNPAICTRSFLKFDLSILPPGSTITSAQLYLYCWGKGTSPDVSSHYVNDDTWGEGAITWNNQPAFNAAATDTTTVNNTATWFSWDVTADAINEHGGDGTLSVMVKDTAAKRRPAILNPILR